MASSQLASVSLASSTFSSKRELPLSRPGNAQTLHENTAHSASAGPSALMADVGVGRLQDDCLVRIIPM